MLTVTEQPRTLGKYPLTASLYLEKHNPKQHAGMWLSWIFASWRRQQVDEPFVQRAAQRIEFRGGMLATGLVFRLGKPSFLTSHARFLPSCPDGSS